MEKLVIGVVGLALVAAMIFVFAVIFAWPTMWLWNNSLVPAFPPGAVLEITFWQAMGILFLSGLLFKSSSSSSN